MTMTLALCASLLVLATPPCFAAFAARRERKVVSTSGGWGGAASLISSAPADRAETAHTSSSLGDFLAEQTPTHESSRASTARARLKVGFVVFVTDISSPEWEDALRVLAFGVNKAVSQSRHEGHLLALAPERFPAEKEKKLLDFGFEEVLRRPVPVEASLVQGTDAREHMQRVNGDDKRFQFKMEEETIKYWGMTQTDYDRVLVLDADTMVLSPMDELMEAEADFVGTYDHGLDSAASTLPPAQGGFLLFRPRKDDFEEIKRLTQEGDWGGDGWKNSGIGYCYGGVGPDGLLAYYYNKDALSHLSPKNKTSLVEGLGNPRVPGSRMQAVERAQYDVVVNARLISELKGANEQEVLSNVKSAHFTGNCIKPWTCYEAKDFLCAGLTAKWWQLRAELEQHEGLAPTPTRCEEGRYIGISKSTLAF